MNRLIDIRRRAGCWCHERWRAECALHPGLIHVTGIRWQDLHNRIERLGAGGDDASRVCDWQWTSELTVCQVFPQVGGRILRTCFDEWQLGLADEAAPTLSRNPKISVILPVGGKDRHASLRPVLRAFLRQSILDYEVIVAEQGCVSGFADQLPEGVRHVLVAGSDDPVVFNKSAVMNVAVSEARAPWVLLHDADIVVPRRYLEAVVGRIQAGWEAVRPIRFLFYLNEEMSVRFTEDDRLPACIERVTQNFPGGSTAISREAYWDIGGHDERFVGWGGEDTEFLDRLRTRRAFPGHFAPALHLWHAPAPKKMSGDRNQEFLDRCLGVPVEMRIRELRARLSNEAR